MACILVTLAVSFIISSMNLQCIWEVGRGRGRLISNRMSYRNHYMCNGEVTCILQPNIHKAQILYWYKKQKSQHFAFTGKKLSESLYKSTIVSLSSCYSSQIVCKSASLSVSEWVCLFVCSLTSPKRWTPASWNFEGWFPSGCKIF